jgi:hypothetical protein
MHNTTTEKIRVSTDSSVHLKKCWSVGPHILVVIADELVKRFGITEDSTYVQQEITYDVILLRVKHSLCEICSDGGTTNTTTHNGEVNSVD